MSIPNILIESITKDTLVYLDWLGEIELGVDKDFLLAGSFESPTYPVWPRHHDNFHYPLGMRRLLSLGFCGIRDTALKNSERFEGNQKKYLLLIHDVYKRIADIVEEFTKVANGKGLDDIYAICNALSHSAPRTFLEACQLYWFSTLFRIGTSTVGRIDQHLYPFYKADLKKGLIDAVTAGKIISELLFRFEKRGGGRGDTLQNITLGGRNAEGEDQTNDLTYIILESCIKNKYIEPKINVRVNRQTPQRLLDLISELQFGGTGICTVFNDEMIIEGLIKHGRPVEVASDYCADGCSEIILDGIGETWFRYIDCVKAVEHVLFNGGDNVPLRKQLQYYSNTQDYLDVKSPVEKGMATGDFLKMETFEQFYRAYLSQLKYQTDLILSKPYNSDEFPMRLFTAATMPGVIEDACEPYSNTSCFHTYGLFIGSLGTAVNSVAAIKLLVYEKKLISKEDLINALRGNFENQPIIRQLCMGAPKFGNDSDYVDAIAADVAEKFASWVREYEDRIGRPILPGLYNHLFHHTAYSVGATPDGRRFGDPVGEHLSPTPGTAGKGPTAVINSVCKINTGEQIFGSTLHLNIPKISLNGSNNPKNLLKWLVMAFCAEDGCVLNASVLDSEKLLEAQKHPETHKDLIVRVWGFSYYFVQLSKEMQDHVISRSMYI